MDLTHFSRLVLKHQIVGKEQAKVHPDGQWTSVHSIDALREVLLRHAEGKLVEPTHAPSSDYQPILGSPTQIQVAPTLVLTPEQAAELPSGAIPQIEPAASMGAIPEVQKSEDPSLTEIETQKPSLQKNPKIIEEQSLTQIAAQQKPIAVFRSNLPAISDEKTIVFQRPQSKAGPERLKLWDWVRICLIAAGLGYGFYDEIFGPSTPAPALQSRLALVRPRLPLFTTDLPDPAASNQEYLKALSYYQQDTVEGYVRAAELFRSAAAKDINNVKALAMLASTYINLIDSSNKDETYFSVIAKLIEMSRAKSIDLTETVIADVELYLTTNRIEAAKQRIVDYTKNNPKFDPALFYYLATVFFEKGDVKTALRYIQLLPEASITSPRIFYFRAKISEKLEDSETAIQEYGKALALFSSHAKSKLGIAEISNQKTRLKSARAELSFLIDHPQLLSFKDLARANYLASLSVQTDQKWNEALGYIERALKLDPKNHDYLLEFYTLRARLGDLQPQAKNEARMYQLLKVGQELASAGKHHEALTRFMDARQAAIDSPEPLVKMGDMFVSMNELVNARMNYELAAKKAPNSISIWTKYIDLLIRSYEWDEAQAAMDRFRKNTGTASSIDKAAGDLYARQGRQTEAQQYYRKAMARESIDSTVYLAYANSLVTTQNFRDAPFFFALALRFDPTNPEGIIGTAKSIAFGDSIDRGIDYLQGESIRTPGNRALYLSQIAEFLMKKGDWQTAQRTVDEARTIQPDLAEPWRVQALIDLSREGQDKKALEKALASFKSYSDRNISDPSGYLERYKILARLNKFDEAREELNKIYAIYPKYPNLHFFKAQLYSMMGNRKVAVEEFQVELKNNPGSVTAMISLGKELIEIQQPKEALEQFQKAMAAVPAQAEPKALAAHANFLLKNYSGALALYQAALALDRGNPLYYKRIGLVYRAIGDLAGARESFRKYLEMEPDATDRAEFEKFL